MSQEPPDPTDRRDAPRPGPRPTSSRLRLDAEPLDVQLARRRAVCWVLTAVTTAIAAAFLALFAAFDRPDLGLALAALLWLPIVGGSWWDFSRLAREARTLEEHLADGAGSSTDG
ncbi:hypothetical protein [Planctomyces sp. SH-PL62]|uniref:hypothetical protein n=1 Tax=Planctomyces sp. SH-PL62 TaxID=1636152 RepID=UPI00078E8D45|nr:hypothetical protein [Planctomyces sp. SH-PL62]AMV39951.1 hypothetical protein VT85_21135 [Planctomyces sp. SH-PL62]